MPTFVDNFADTDGVLLQNHTPNTGTSWTRLWGTTGTNAEINSNQCRSDGDLNSGVMYTADATYPSADYDITCTLASMVGNNDRPIFLLVRVQDQENMYGVRLENTASESSLYKKVAGTWTAVGSLFTKPAAGSVIKLEIIGTALKFYDDGVEIASATVSDISAAGKPGIGFGGGTELVTSGDDGSTSNAIDTLTVNDLGALTLVVQEATHTHAADGIALTVDAFLAVADATHAHSSDAIGLTVNAQLAVSDATHEHSVDAIVLTANAYLTVADARHEHAVDTIGLTVEAQLTVTDATHEHAVDGIGLTVNAYLAVSDATHAHSSDSIDLTASSTLAVDDATHEHVTDGITLSVDGSVTLSINDASHEHAADTIGLTVNSYLVLNDASHEHASDSITLSLAYTITITDAVHLHAADGIALTAVSHLTVQDATHLHSADGIVLTSDSTAELVVQNAVHLLVTDVIVLEVIAFSKLAGPRRRARGTLGDWSTFEGIAPKRKGKRTLW